MKSKERLISELMLEEADTVPVSIRLNPNTSHMLGDTFFRWALKHTDSIFRLGLGEGIFYSSKTRYHVQRLKVNKEQLIQKITIETPKGPLTCLTRITKWGSDWTIKPFIENENDIEKFLSIPDESFKPDIHTYLKLKRSVNNYCLIFITLSDAIGVVASLFKLNTFLKYCLTRLDLIKEMVYSVAGRIESYIEYLLAKGVGPVYEIFGPEYVSQTFLRPEYFKELVLGVDRKLVKLIHEYGYLVGMHCHGRIRSVLNDIANTGFDALHPIEEPPRGDITLSEAKELVGHKICLIGNIPHGLLEKGTSNEVREFCLYAIKSAAPGGGYIMEPTATPLKSTKKENLIELVKTGRRYGKYPLC